jgi:hypothetical protein
LIFLFLFLILVNLLFLLLLVPHEVVVFIDRLLLSFRNFLRFDNWFQEKGSWGFY